MTKRLFDELDSREIRERAVVPPSAPAPVTAFLGRLSLLHGVPFGYLVADEKLLPAESLKIFAIDPQWIDALIAGALSVGCGDTVRLLLNKTLAGNFVTDVLAEARALRASKRDAGEPQSAAGPPAGETVPSFSFSGFLLRSGILEAWPGLEVRAFGSGTSGKVDELSMLRLDRVAPDILFGLVDGQVSALEITQPPEGLHFATSGTEEPPYRGKDGEARVLDVRKWATGAAASAAFAQQRIAQPLRFVFAIGG